MRISIFNSCPRRTWCFFTASHLRRICTENVPWAVKPYFSEPLFLEKKEIYLATLVCDWGLCCETATSCGSLVASTSPFDVWPPLPRIPGRCHLHYRDSRSLVHSLSWKFRDIKKKFSRSWKMIVKVFSTFLCQFWRFLLLFSTSREILERNFLLVRYKHYFYWIVCLHRKVWISYSVISHLLGKQPGQRRSLLLLSVKSFNLSTGQDAGKQQLTPQKWINMAEGGKTPESHKSSIVTSPLIKDLSR